jgi:hypothetical protein
LRSISSLTIDFDFAASRRKISDVRDGIGGGVGVVDVAAVGFDGIRELVQIDVEARKRVGTEAAGVITPVVGFGKPIERRRSRFEDARGHRSERAAQARVAERRSASILETRGGAVCCAHRLEPRAVPPAAVSSKSPCAGSSGASTSAM